MTRRKRYFESFKKSVLVSIIFVLSFAYYSYPQDSKKLEELKDSYFKEWKYAEFVDYLVSLGTKDKTMEPFVNYYIAFSRYHQLKYLEETQNWNEYFSQANAYKEELVNSAQKAIDSTKAENAVNIYARLLLWQFHKDGQDAFVDDSLSGLMDAVIEYAKTAEDLKPIREVADRLFAYQEKGKSKELYRLYVDKLIAAEVSDARLHDEACNFYKEENLELSCIVFDSYIERILKSMPADKTIPVLIDIAKLFAYKDGAKGDGLYAENVFKRIETLGGKEIFNEELMYLRAFNLEKAKDFLSAKDKYVELVQHYPETVYSDEAIYKAGVICGYILKDIKSGREYFEKLAQKEAITPHAISSLYQLGLLSQRDNDSAKAKEYYNKLIDKAKEGFSEDVTFAKERLKEIEESKPIDYNLRMFLDAEATVQSNINASIYRLKKDEDVKITSCAGIPESGCMQVELQYLWSGNTGRTRVSSEQLQLLPSFDTAYTESGTKVVNLVVVSPAGVIDKSIDMFDVY